MKTVKQGDYVKVHYTGRFDDGEVFDSSGGCKPLEVCVGASQVIPGFEKALLGMSANEKKTFSVEPGEGYGDRDEDLERNFQLSDFPPEFNPEVGQVIVLQSPDNDQFPATIKNIGKDDVVLDMNHPLAGQVLTFEVEVLEISDVPSESPCSCGCSSCS